MSPHLRVVTQPGDRPTLLDPLCIRRAVTRHAFAITDWARKRSYSADDEFTVAAIVDAIEHARGDEARAVRTLQIVHGWTPDEALGRHLSMALKHLKECHRYCVIEWVLRTGTRFPGRVTDLVVFWDGVNQRTGRIKEIHREIAAAMIEGESGTTDLVVAELIVCNRTRGVDYGVDYTDAPPVIALPAPQVST